MMTSAKCRPRNVAGRVWLTASPYQKPRGHLPHIRIVCIVGYHNHPNYKRLRHLFIPLFGLLANLACMAASYVVLPFMGIGTKLEPFTALAVAAIWLIYGRIYFTRSSKATGRTTLVDKRARAALS
jgi:hypothetical protein